MAKQLMLNDLQRITVGLGHNDLNLSLQQIILQNTGKLSQEPTFGIGMVAQNHRNSSMNRIQDFMVGHLPSYPKISFAT